MESLTNYKIRLYYILICIAITLPFSMRINNLFIVLLFVNFLFQREKSIKITSALLLIFFYLMHIGSLFYTSNIDQGLFELEKKIGFIVFSVVMVSSPQLDQDKFKNVLLAFVVSCIVASIFCLGYATFQLILYGTYEYFFYHSLTEVIGMHAIYMAMYLCFCIFVLINFSINNIIDGKGQMRMIILCILIYLSIFIFLLSARVIIMSFIMIVIFGLILYGYKRIKIWKMLSIATLLLIIFSSLILLIPSNLDRFKEAINYKSQYSIDKQYGGRSTRELIWSCSLQVIKENIFIGVGSGDTQDELQNCYQGDLQKNWALLYRPEFQYNAHSQYLQTFIDLGILGMVVFLACLIVPIIIAIKYKDYLFLSFMVLFSLACLTESMLELNKGIVFFSFFSSLFLNQYKSYSII